MLAPIAVANYDVYPDGQRLMIKAKDQESFGEGMAEIEKELMISPDSIRALSELGYAYALEGRREEARKVLDKLNELSKQSMFPL